MIGYSIAYRKGSKEPLDAFSVGMIAWGRMMVIL